MDRAFALALEYLKTRVQFDKKIGSFQALQHRAVDEYMEVEIARSLVFQVAAAFDRGQGNAAMAAAVKTRASAAALRVCKTALQFHGAMGYTDEHDIGLYLKRAMVLAAQFGNEAQSRRRFARLAGLEPA
jgi:alkylation response protein AidB-like acyl-CoA dehydrogenase